MDELLKFDSVPEEKEIYMISGWRQWADAGEVSSSLPPYLAKLTNATKIGELNSASFYLFQIPGTQAAFRPEIKLEDGFPRELRTHKSEIYYSTLNDKGLVIFTGDEPQLNIERYAEAFFNLAKELKVKRVVALGGVYAAVPFDKERHVSCTFSLPELKAEMERYAVRFSNYEGGVSIGSYLATTAAALGIEYIVLHAFVPMYDVSSLVPGMQSVGIDEDYKAWLDVTRRLDHMFGLGLDLDDLETKSRALIASMNARVEEMAKTMPQAKVKDFLKKIDDNFEEMPYAPLDVWEDGLKDLFKDEEET